MPGMPTFGGTGGMGMFPSEPGQQFYDPMQEAMKPQYAGGSDQIADLMNASTQNALVGSGGFASGGIPGFGGSGMSKEMMDLLGGMNFSMTDGKGGGFSVGGGAGRQGARGGAGGGQQQAALMALMQMLSNNKAGVR